MFGKVCYFQTGQGRNGYLELFFRLILVNLFAKFYIAVLFEQ